MVNVFSRFWALALYGGNGETGFEQNSTYSVFSICVTLTDEGYKHFYEVNLNCSLEWLFSLFISLFSLFRCPWLENFEPSSGCSRCIPVLENVAASRTWAKVMKSLFDFSQEKLVLLVFFLLFFCVLHIWADIVHSC